MVSLSKIPRVTFRFIADPAAQVASLLSGDVDMLTDLPTQDVAKLRQDTKLKVVDGPEVRTIFIALDQGSDELKYSNVKGKNPFKDKRVREALSIAIDRQTLVDVGYGPAGRPHAATCMAAEPCVLFIAFDGPVDVKAYEGEI